MKTLVIGIASYEQIKARTIAIAQGVHKPKKEEPKVWFRSIELLASGRIHGLANGEQVNSSFQRPVSLTNKPNQSFMSPFVRKQEVQLNLLSPHH